jgi:hypothetical protein
MYLGFPARFHQTQPELEQAFLALATVPDDEAQVVALLEKLTAAVTGVDARLEGALDRLQAAEVGSIKLNAREVGGLRSEGRRIVARIARIMGVTPQGDSYSGGISIDNEMRQG